MPRHRRFLRPLLAAFLAFALVLAISACGYSSTSKDVAEGQTVKLGQLQYTVVFSPLPKPERQRRCGLPRRTASAATAAPTTTASSSRSKTKTRWPTGCRESLRISDAEHQVFDAIPTKSLYALPLGGKVEAEEQVPLLDSPAQQGPIEGSLVLFRLPLPQPAVDPSIPGPEGPAKFCSTSAALTPPSALSLGRSACGAN